MPSADPAPRDPGAADPAAAGSPDPGAPGTPGAGGGAAPGRPPRPAPGAPPWWPEGEAWPPRRGTWRGRDWGGVPPSGRRRDAGPWMGHRGGMARGIGCFLIVALLVAGLAGAALLWLAGAVLGFVEVSHVARIGAVAGIVVGLVLIVGVARRVQAVVRPVDDLVAAAGRVEQGDYTARVAERGPRDIRSLSRAFNAMSARLEETDRQRRAYLADVTHELRTPLAVIRGHLEAIADGVYPADAEHLEPVLDATRTLDGLVEDLRTLTLVETGSLTLRREAVDMAVLVTDVVASLRATSAAAGVTLTPDLPPDLPTVDADPVRIRSVLANLLANAVRHTPSGGTVQVTAGVATTAGRRFLRVAVRDGGPGFAPEILPRAFERFVKAPDSPGSGLGLAIARDLVVAHGGTIEAHNEPAGAVVSFTLPIDGVGGSRGA